MNLSGSLLIWTLGQMSNEFYQKVKNTYIGCVVWEGSNTWGDYYYVVFQEDLSANTIRDIRNHPMYQDSFYTDEGNQVVVFKFTEEQKEKIIKPFIAGQYSQIDREYVNQYFKMYSHGDHLSTNWQILTKDPNLRARGEQELNVTPYIRISIPEDAEVWSKIKKEKEILGYEAYAQTQEEVLESM